jgi:hypothetical protein
MTYVDPATELAGQAPAAPSESSAPAPAPSFKKGDVVVHQWDDPGTMSVRKRYGLVVDVVADSVDAKGNPESGGPMIAWLSIELSGPMPPGSIELA